MAKKSKKAKRIKLLKVEKVAPDKHHIHLEVEEAPELPEPVVEPVVVHEDDSEAPKVNSIARWFNGLWR